MLGSWPIAGRPIADGAPRLAGAAGSSIIAATGSSATATIAGSARSAATISAASGASATNALTGSQIAAAAISAAAGASTTAALTSVAVAAASITSASGVSTTGTLVGSSVAAGSSSFVVAAGSSTTGTLAGRARAAASFAVAAGRSVASIVYSSGGAQVPSAIPGWYYVPGAIPSDAAPWLMRELRAISQASRGAAPVVQFQVSAREPDKFRPGAVYYADGVNWNPGSGEGLYVRKSSGWSFLG